MITNTSPAYPKRKLMSRIAMLTVHTSPLAPLGSRDAGGLNVYVRALADGLARRGLSVDIFTRSQSLGQHGIVPLGSRTRLIHLKAGPRVPADKNRVFNHLPEFLAGLERFAAERSLTYDLVHSHYWLSGGVAGQLRQRWGIPLVHRFHTLGRLKNQVAKTTDQREGQRRIQLEQEITGLADRLVAATTLEKAQLISLYGADPQKVTVISGGVDVCLFRPIPQAAGRALLALARDRDIVLYVGRIEPLKGIDLLIKAMALVLENPGIQPRRPQLVIVGGDAPGQQVADREMGRLQRLVQELGLGDAVAFVGPRAQEELPHFYAAADVCVVPSYYESFGLVALEAMACGTPVIGSNVGGLAFTIKDTDTGFLVPAGDAMALAGKIELLLTNPHLRARLGAEGARRASTYRWSRVTRQVLTLYRGILAKSAPPARQTCTNVACVGAVGPCIQGQGCCV